MARLAALDCKRHDDESVQSAGLAMPTAHLVRVLLPLLALPLLPLGRLGAVAASPPFPLLSLGFGILCIVLVFFTGLLFLLV